MKIGQQSVHHLELIRRVNEDVCLPGSRLELPIVSTALEHSHHSCANGHGAIRILNIRHGFRGEVVALAVHVMLSEVVIGDRTKGSDPHMQSHKTVRQRLQHFVRKVQPGSRGSDSAGLPCINRLVALAVVRGIRPVDIGRESEVPMGVFIRFPVKFDNAFSPFFADLHDRAGALSNLDRVADLESLAGTNETLPALRAQQVDAENFLLSIVREITRRHNPGVVQNQSIIGIDEIGKIGKPLMRDFTTLAVNHHHARLPPPLGRTLRDQLVGQLVIKVTGLHRTRLAQTSKMSTPEESQRQRASDITAKAVP